MELQTLAVAGPLVGRCCSCSCCSRTSAWRRCVKRKLDRAEADATSTPASGDAGDAGVARVEVENEVAALREAIASQQDTIQELYAELEEERNASASATSEAMSMILRLQREKAEVQMEARQFKRFAEEQMAHDQEELAALEDFIFRRDEAIQSLSFQLQAYRHRLLSYEVDPDADSPSPMAEPATLPASHLPDIDVVKDGEQTQTPKFEDVPIYEYPPLKCKVPEFGDGSHVEADIDLEKYAFEERPRHEEEFESLEARIFHLEETTIPTDNHSMEKDIFQQSESKNHEEHPVMVNRASSDDDEDADGMSDRVYTIDAVHGVRTAGVSEDSGFPLEEKEKRRPFAQRNGVEENVDIKKLYTRLQALEEDREAMRQAIVSMRTEKAQLVLLKEMAEQLHKGVVPERRAVKKTSPSMSFSIIVLPVLKWIASFVLWKRKATPSKYKFGLSNNNAGLLLLLDKSPPMTYWKTPTRITIMTATNHSVSSASVHGKSS